MTNENLALPFVAETWQNYPAGWGWFNAAHPQIIYFDDPDNPSPSGKPSIRLEPHTNADGNASREIDCGKWPSCKAGDRIIFKMKMKTGQSQNANGANNGARIGLDFYGPNGIVDMYVLANGVNAEANGSFVGWNTPNWTEQIIDCTVPDGYGITSVAPWGQALPATDPAFAWFGEPEIYINPDMTQPPFTTPTPTPEVYTCPFDGLTFPTQAELDVHLLAVHGQPPPVVYTCPFDNLTFSTQAALDAHLLAVHSIPTPTPEVYTCPYDGLTFATQAELDAHLLAVHPAPTPTPTPSASVAARVPCFGNRALVQVYLRRLRDKVFSKRAHERLHPLI